MNHGRHTGFTLIELLVVIAIIGILAGAVTITSTEARKKAQDALVKQNLSSIRSVAEEVYFSAYPHTYLPVCFESMVDLILDDLASSTAVAEQDYQCISSNEEWLAIFPLKMGGYWCSDGKGRSMQVDGFVEYSTPEYLDCLQAVSPDPVVEENPPAATSTPSGGSTATPYITLSGGETVEVWSKSKNPFKGGAWHKYHEPGYQAYDAEDGDISDDIVVIGPTLVSVTGPKQCREYNYEINYDITNSGNKSGQTVTRNIIHRRCKQN